MNNEPILNTRLCRYNIKIVGKVSTYTRWVSHKDKQCVSMLIINLMSCYRRNSRLVYSRDRYKKTDKSKKNITTHRVIKAVDFLEKEGYIVNHIGKAKYVT